MYVVETYRTGWTLNEIVAVEDPKTGKSVNRLKAVYLCYIAQYGRSPVYIVQSLDSERVGSFKGTKEALFQLFKNHVPVKVSLTSKINGFFDEVKPDIRDKELASQMDLEYKQKETLKVVVNNAGE